MDVEPSSMASFSVIGAWSPRADASCLVHNCHNIEEMCSGLGPVVNGLPAACPYVSIRYGDKTAKTITLRNTVQPIWNSPCFALYVIVLYYVCVYLLVNTKSIKIAYWSRCVIVVVTSCVVTCATINSRGEMM